MSKQYPHVRKALHGMPWAIMDGHLEAYIEIAEAHIERVANGEAATYPTGGGSSSKNDEPDYYGNVAVVPVSGPIIKNAGLFDRISGATSPAAISSKFAKALDSDAETVMLRFDSPGGSVAGIPELATEVYEATRKSDKRIIALADGMMASAAYWIGCQCNAVYATEASPVGSIGVVASITDPTRALKNQGIDPVTIKSSELKAIGQGPMTPNQVSAMQAHVMKMFSMFKDAVVRGREGIDIENACTGLTYFGQEAISLGLIDGISTFDALIEKYS